MNVSDIIIFLMPLCMMALPAYLAWIIVCHHNKGVYDWTLKFSSYANIYVCVVFFIFAVYAWLTKFPAFVSAVNLESFKLLYKGVALCMFIQFFVAYPYYVIFQRRFKDKYVLFNTLFFPVYGLFGFMVFLFFSAATV